MEMPGTWEKLLVGVLVVLLLFWMRPGIKAMLQQSREATERDWAGFLWPLAIVAGFVVLLMALM